MFNNLTKLVGKELEKQVSCLLVLSRGCVEACEIRVIGPEGSTPPFCVMIHVRVLLVQLWPPCDGTQTHKY